MHLVWAYVVTFLWGLSALTTKYAVTHRHRPMSAITTSALMYLGAVAAFVVTVVWFDRASLGVISRDVRTCSPALVACVVVRAEGGAPTVATGLRFALSSQIHGSHERHVG